MVGAAGGNDTYGFNEAPALRRGKCEVPRGGAMYVEALQ